jgi:16S rRNA (cytosine967-C5)-methyltransferase
VLAKRQSELLAAAWPMLKPGGRLVYASCSILRVETTGVISSFLARTQDAREITGQILQGMQIDGIDAALPGHAIATGTAGMDGFYYACLEKSKG